MVQIKNDLNLIRLEKYEYLVKFELLAVGSVQENILVPGHALFQPNVPYFINMF